MRIHVATLILAVVRQTRVDDRYRTARRSRGGRRAAKSYLDLENPVRHCVTVSTVRLRHRAFHHGRRATWIGLDDRAGHVQNCDASDDLLDTNSIVPAMAGGAAPGVNACHVPDQNLCLPDVDDILIAREPMVDHRVRIAKDRETEDLGATAANRERLLAREVVVLRIGNRVGLGRGGQSLGAVPQAESRLCRACGVDEISGRRDDHALEQSGGGWGLDGRNESDWVSVGRAPTADRRDPIDGRGHGDGATAC